MKKFISFLLAILLAFYIAYLINIHFFVTPKISVIIPCYNSEKYLQDVFFNLKAQTFSDYEVIFVDDGSTDNTGKMLSDYKKNDKRAKLITINSNKGAGEARNIGLKQARGNYVIFLDSDDIYYPKLLEESYNAAIKSNADITMFKSGVYNEAKKEHSDKDIGWLWEEPYPVERIFTPEDVKDHLFTFCRGAVWNKLYKRKFLKQHNFKFLNLKMHNDSYFVYCTYAMAKSMYITDKILIEYRINRSDSIFTKYEDKYDNSCKIESFNALSEFLIKNGLYDKYKNALQEYSDTY